jgi:hypothetical protein
MYKKFRGLLNEAYSSADAYLLKCEYIKQSFRINVIFTFVVPMDLDVKMKAMSLAALFLIVSFLFKMNPLLLYFLFL